MTTPMSPERREQIAKNAEYLAKHGDEASDLIRDQVARIDVPALLAEVERLTVREADLTAQLAGAHQTADLQQREMAAARPPHRRCWVHCPEAPHAVCTLAPGHGGAHESAWSGGQHVSWGGAS